MTEQHDNQSNTAPASTENSQTPEGGTSGTPDAQNGSESPKGNREARYRVERNQAREERDALATRVELLQTRELERIAGEAISNPSDLLALTGKSLSEFLDEDGELDTELVTEAARELLSTRPGLRKQSPAFDPTQGVGGSTPKPKAGWDTLLSS
ncbi:hypothetical protein H7J51_17900 [Mycobacterium crocinum]|uniref:DUF4355 domain-containing protein n=1 Tax=Mycolicibacterium crocinum TaxID=388459 RepID=A0ABY3TRC6_9MYCO|nr:hypothetical protein [Mycolicibacterium crocinum]MCV7217147.1 hypothetical protein [Mycolicibacterium crocinum]ULN42891.1 hypothetical protein MI149_07305 [Mycolicibacterium crocinum]